MNEFIEVCKECDCEEFNIIIFNEERIQKCHECGSKETKIMIRL